MKRVLLSIFSLMTLGVSAQIVNDATSLVDYVNPLMGSMSKPSMSNGNTYPAIGLPWGMNLWTPQTGKNGDGWQYTYTADKIVGLKQTHQPSPWMNDYDEFSIMPVTGSIIYLYDYAGTPWKTQYCARETMNRMYRATLDGYCGDEDNGQTSAWYVFSALGFYPVTSASTQYTAGASLFKHAELHFENGNTLHIDAANNSADNRFVESATVNGKIYTKNYFDHFALQKGGTINIKMSDKPNTQRGTRDSDFPFSLTKLK